MKRAFMGISALGVAIAAVAFTTPQKATTTYVFAQTSGGAFTSQPYVTGGAPSTTDLGCPTGPSHCEGKFSGYVTNFSGSTPTSWSPNQSDLIGLVGKPL